jgi:hypothetical protein
MDWALNERRFVDPNFLSVSVEMRPQASGGTFDLPASHIVPAGKELTASVLAAARAHYDQVNYRGPAMTPRGLSKPHEHKILFINLISILKARIMLSFLFVTNEKVPMSKKY